MGQYNTEQTFLKIINGVGARRFADATVDYAIGDLFSFEGFDYAVSLVRPQKENDALLAFGHELGDELISGVVNFHKCAVFCINCAR